MDFEAILIIGSFAVVIGAVLLAIALPLSRRLLQRHPHPHGHIRVTRFGVCAGMAQFLGPLGVIGWGFFHPQTALGQLAAHPAGAPAIFILGGIVFCPIFALLQRAGIVLFYRVQGGG